MRKTFISATGTLSLLLASCTAPTAIPEQCKTPPPVVRQSTLSIDFLVELHRSELEDLARRAQQDNIERGGIILDANGKTAFIEVHNVFRDGPELIEKYTAGAHHLYEALDELITTAALVRTTCNPCFGSYYTSRAIIFRNILTSIPLTKQANQGENAQLHAIYSELALHSTYRGESSALRAIEQKGTPRIHVHTHQGRTRERKPDDNDHLAPSRQDLIVSKKHEGLVVAMTHTGEYLFYHTTQGSYRQLERPALASLPR